MVQTLFALCAWPDASLLAFCAGILQALTLSSVVIGSPVASLVSNSWVELSWEEVADWFVTG